MTSIFCARENSHIKLDIDKDTTALIYIDGDLSIDINAYGHKLNLVYIVDTDDKFIFKQTGNIQDTEVSILYIDISNALVRLDSSFNLKDRASLSLVNKYLVSAIKKIDITCANEGKSSSVNIDNSAVILDSGDIDMRCAGQIIKGATSSKSHQKTRSLVYGSPKRVAIDPVLLIEESDVEASHAMSSGTIDADVLYYMESRGIDELSALRLMIESYLSVDDYLLSAFSNTEEIKEKINKRIERYVR